MRLFLPALAVVPFGAGLVVSGLRKPRRGWSGPLTEGDTA